MDVVGASEELSLIDWEEELKGTVNESWESCLLYTSDAADE